MKKYIFYSLIVLLLGACGIRQEKNPFPERENLFNHGWEFVKDVEDDAVFSGENLQWQQISLPHTAHVEPLVIEDRQWQGTAYYRKSFFVPELLKDKHLALHFEGAMQVSDVYINGNHVKSSYSGYLPFHIDLTGHVRFGEENTVLVRLNNEDNPQVPPGKPLDDLDFNYFSGIYRNVWLQVKDKLHISDPIGADRTAAGGILVTFSDVSHESAVVNVQVDVSNVDEEPAGAKVKLVLKNADGAEVASAVSETKDISPGSWDLFGFSLDVERPELWSPSNLYLYSLTAEVYNGDVLTDRETQRIGIRTFRFTTEGFELNGEPFYLRGTNRHQEYPYIGYALSDNAQYRDAWKIRSAGYNFVRLSHYPHSKAFMNALDELGLLSMNAIPGWQFFGDELFQERSLNDVRKMMRRDRNHPSVILWEASLNETEMTDEFMQRAHDLVYEEYPAEDVYTCGWWEGVFDVYIPARQHGTPPHYWNHYDGGKPIFIAEYGDWEYYAHNAGFNQSAFEDLTPDERNSRQLRGFGQRRLAQQALNKQEAHNSNLKGSPAGDANWLVFDYNRGYAPDLEASGVMDIFRVPKFAYWFYKSQARIGEFPVEEFNEPFVYIANFYHDPTFLEVKVYSNTEEIELFVNGNSLGRQQPDADEYSTHLNQPPFTFHLESFIPGELKAVGYIDGEEVVSSIRLTPGDATGIKIWVDESNRPLARGQNDMVFLYAAVIDQNGTIIPEASNEILFELKGDGELIGYNPMAAEAGIATILLKAGDKGGRLNISAVSSGLNSAKMTLTVR
jgi:beta-galactosidase